MRFLLHINSDFLIHLLIKPKFLSLSLIVSRHTVAVLSSLNNRQIVRTQALILIIVAFSSFRRASCSSLIFYASRFLVSLEKFIHGRTIYVELCGDNKWFSSCLKHSNDKVFCFVGHFRFSIGHDYKNVVS